MVASCDHCGLPGFRSISPNISPALRSASNFDFGAVVHDFTGGRNYEYTVRLRHDPSRAS